MSQSNFKERLTSSLASSTVPVKLCTTPDFPPFVRPPSTPNPSSFNIFTKSACAARECRNSGRWYFFARLSCMPVIRIKIEGGHLQGWLICVRMNTTHGSSDVVSPHRQNVTYHSLTSDQKRAIYHIGKLGEPNPHSPTATTRPGPLRWELMISSRAWRYPSGPLWYLSNSADRVGWQPTVAYRSVQ